MTGSTGESGEHDLIGGRYRLLEPLGTRPGGRIWRAEDELLHRPVAIKEIGVPPDVSASTMLDRQLATMREARAAARLDHPGVVRVYDVIWRPGSSWIVLEYVESRSLHDTVEQDGPLPAREAARIGLAVLSALRAAHHAGVLHRDVEPHHVLLATDGRVVLSDFGLADAAGDGRQTAGYVAPERASGARAAAAADLWSLGATLHLAVHGTPPTGTGSAATPARDGSAAAGASGVTAGPLDAVIGALLTDDPAARMTADEAEPRLRRIATRAVGVFPVTVLPGAASSAAGAGRSVARDRRASRLSWPALPLAGRWRRSGSPRAASPGTPTGPDLGPSPSPLAGRAGGLARSTRIAIGVAAALLIGTAGTALVLDSAADPIAEAPPPATGTETAPTAAGTEGPPPTADADAAPPTARADAAPPTATPGAEVSPAAASPLSGDVRALCGTGASAVPVGGGDSAGHRFDLPAGWRWHDGAGGSAVAVPPDWVLWAEGATTCFRDPDGGRTFGVRTAPERGVDAPALWRTTEKDALAAGALPGYQRIALRALPLRHGGAEWQYAWTAADGVRWRVSRTLVTVGADRGFVVDWSSREQDWRGGEPLRQLVVASLS